MAYDDDEDEDEENEARGRSSAVNDLGKANARANDLEARANGARATTTTTKTTSEDDGGGDFSTLLARGFAHDGAGEAMRERGARGVADKESQRRLEQLMEALAQGYRACSMEERNSEWLSSAVDAVVTAHDRCPSWLRIPEETNYSKLAAHARNLVQRVDEMGEMAKNIPQSSVQVMEDVCRSMSANIPIGMNNFDGMNAIISLRALTQTLDRARGASTTTGGVDATLEDKADKCSRLVDKFLDYKDHDTKATMHSRYNVAMSELRRQSSHELTMKSFDDNTSDTDYLWFALRELTYIFDELKSIDPHFQRCIPNHLYAKCWEIHKKKVEKMPDTSLKCAQFMIFVVISAYKSVNEKSIKAIRSELNKTDVSVVTLGDFCKRMSGLIGMTQKSVPLHRIQIKPVNKATAEQLIELYNMGITPIRDMTQDQAEEMLRGARISIETQPSVIGKKRIDVREPRRFAEAPTATNVLDNTQALKLPVKPSAQKSDMRVEKCKLCGGEIKGYSTDPANSANMHLRSKVHKAWLEKQELKLENAKTVPPSKVTELKMHAVPPPPIEKASSRPVADASHAHAPATSFAAPPSNQGGRPPVINQEVPPPPPPPSAGDPADEHLQLSPQLASRLGDHPSEKCEPGELPFRLEDLAPHREPPFATSPSTSQVNKRPRDGSLTPETSDHRTRKTSRAADGPPPCKYFTNGVCRYGVHCHFAHDREKISRP